MKDKRQGRGRENIESEKEKVGMQLHHHTHEVYSLRHIHLQLYHWIKGIQKI